MFACHQAKRCSRGIGHWTTFENNIDISFLVAGNNAVLGHAVGGLQADCPYRMIDNLPCLERIRCLVGFIGIVQGILFQGFPGLLLGCRFMLFLNRVCCWGTAFPLAAGPRWVLHWTPGFAYWPAALKASDSAARAEHLTDVSGQPVRLVNLAG